MAKTLKIDVRTGRIEVPTPDEDADARDAATLELTAEIGAELDALEQRVDAEPRDVLKQVWVLNAWTDAYPKNWIKDFGKRRERNALQGRIDELRKQAQEALGVDQGKAIWEDLDFLRKVLPLLFEKQRASGEVLRLILSPLGKLKFCQIQYSRTGAEDLARVCQEVQEEVRRTNDLDEQALAWGLENHAALLSGQPPARIPTKLQPPGGGGPLLGLGALLAGGGGAVAAGLVAGVPTTAGLGGAGLGALLLLVGGFKAKKAGAARAELPERFAELSARFRERLYLICTLRVLYRVSSRYTVAADAYDSAIKDYGGNQKWKALKFEGRDLTEVFAAESWDPRGSIEHWLAEKVKQNFRLDSMTLAAPEDLDAEAWDVLLKAYLLESEEFGAASADGAMLATVSDLLFTKRGEDVSSERARVFGEVQAAWERAQEERAAG